MGLLKWFSDSRPAVRRLPAGSFTVDRHGNVMTANVSSTFPAGPLAEIAREVLALFREARTSQMPLAEISLQFASLHITARDLQGGAIIFLSPQNVFANSPPDGTRL
ncbi:MAG TPA: hypothetical protein VGH42_07220 [Verrucomicrobiae bacterium]|jgi:hypothetical protein